ncbi:MAG: Ig-like domain-containing protein, partial [Clostridia bacterium]|nr:Ig-like domain-containing protein [Clostridia bacterium]
KVIVTTSPTGLKLNKTSVNLDLSGTKTTKLTAEVEPATSSNKKIKWTNGNGNVVNMSTSGGTATITGIKNGETTITAKIEGTNISQKCKVIVTTSPQSIKLNKTNITLDKDKTITLTATVNPSTSINKNVIWSSSNTSVATVDKNGKVISKKGGTAIITAKTVNGKTATCKVTVRAGYWEIKNNKYIYHYLDGTSKEWTVSEYIAWNKLKDQKVKALDPKAYKRSGNKIYYAGMWQRYYCLDETANRIAEKNGGSPYAVTVDIDRKHESIFKNNGTNEKPIWEPIKSSRCRVGGKWKNFNNGKGTNDPRYYKKDTLTPIGLYYTNGNHSNIAVESYWKGKPPYWVGFGINYKWFDDGCCKDDYLHNSAFDLYNGPGTGGCVAVGEELSKWIYYNCGRGTPILIW